MYKAETSEVGDRDLALSWKEQTGRVAITATSNFKSDFRELLPTYCNTSSKPNIISDFLTPLPFERLSITKINAQNLTFDTKIKKYPPNTQKKHIVPILSD